MFSELEFQETKQLRHALGDFRLILINNLAVEKTPNNIIWDHLPRAVGEAWNMFKHGQATVSYPTFIRILTTPPVVIIKEPQKPSEESEVIDMLLPDQSAEPSQSNNQSQEQKQVHQSEEILVEYYSASDD